MDAEGFCNFKGIPQGKGNALEHRLRHVRAARIHRHSNKGASRIRIIMRRTLTHQIRQEVNVIFAKLRDRRLLCPIVLRADDLVHPPLIAGRRAQHTAHQMVMSIRMGKGMQRIIFIHCKLIGGNKDRSARSERNIALTVSNCSGSHCCRRVIPCTCCYLYGFRQTEVLRDFGEQRADCLIAFIDLCKLFFMNTADLTHFFRPAAVLHIE